MSLRGGKGLNHMAGVGRGRNGSVRILIRTSGLGRCGGECQLSGQGAAPFPTWGHAVLHFQPYVRPRDQVLTHGIQVEVTSATFRPGLLRGGFLLHTRFPFLSRGCRLDEALGQWSSNSWASESLGGSLRKSLGPTPRGSDSVGT